MIYIVISIFMMYNYPGLWPVFSQRDVPKSMMSRWAFILKTHRSVQTGGKLGPSGTPETFSMLRNIICHEIKTRHVTRRAFWRCVKSLVEKKSRNFSKKKQNFQKSKKYRRKIIEHFSHRIMPLNWAETVMPTAGPAPRVHLVIVVRGLPYYFYH